MPGHAPETRSNPQRADRRARRLLGRADPARGARGGGLSRRALPRPPARRRRRPRPAQPHAARRRRRIHDAYFAAGADIATTNTFTATPIGQADYGLERRRARDERRGRPARPPGRRRVDRAHARQAALRRRRRRAAQRDALAVAERRRPGVPGASASTRCASVRGADARAAEGGVDLLLIETVFDSLNAKAAIVAAPRRRPDVPLWLSFTAVDKQRPQSLGTDGRGVLGLGRAREPARRRRQLLARRRRDAAVRRRPVGHATTWVACYPNAGLPNEFGVYDEQPHDTSRLLGEFARDGLVNIVGGCCGTTPDHVRAIAAAVDGRRAARASRAGARARASAGSSRSRSGPTRTS